MHPIMVGLIFDVFALGCLTLALGLGVPWSSVAPFFAMIIGARASREVRRLMPGQQPPQLPPGGDGGSAGPKDPTSLPPPPEGNTLSRLVMNSGGVALLLAIPAFLISRVRSTYAI